MTDYFAVQLPPEQIRSISSIGLAHIGDAVYELLVRTWLCAGATALEALLGYLYLQGRRDRVNVLFCRMMEGESYAAGCHLPERRGPGDRRPGGKHPH